jgi:hypothetical protein
MEEPARPARSFPRRGQLLIQGPWTFACLDLTGLTHRAKIVGVNQRELGWPRAPGVVER